MPEQKKTPNTLIKIAGIVALCYYLLASIFPKAFWGGHHVSFLPIVVQVIIFFLAIYFILIYPSSKEKPLHETILKPLTKLTNWKIQLIVSIAFGVLFYSFPIHFDSYGDAAFLFTENDVIVQDLNDYDVDRILSFDYSNPKLGTETTLSLISWFSYTLEISSKTIFKLWDSFWGIIFIFLWLRLTALHIKNNSWRILLVLIGSTGSFLQLYFGHFEIYAPVFTGLVLYFHILLAFYNTFEKKKLILLGLILLFCLKFHVTSLILLPSYIATLFIYYKNNKTDFYSISPKWVLKFLFLPAVFLGLIIYFYMGSFNSVRSFTETTWNEVVFLPVVSSESAPLDRYNLFSIYHIIDFSNMIILWSSAAIFMLTSLLIGYRKKINWNSTPLLLIGSTLVLQTGFFFLFNPLLSMPNDWDILSIPVIALLLFILLISKQLEDLQAPKQIIGTVFILSLFSISIFVVNNNQSTLSHKLQKQGEWEYQTYWIGSSTSILAGIALEENLNTQQQRLNKTIDDLEQYAVIGNDIEYAELLYQKAKYFYDKQDYKKALSLFNKADSYSTFICKNHYHQLICNFMLGDYISAHKHSNKLIICQLPTPIRSYEIALHTALEAGDLSFADSICNLYLNRWPKNNFIANIHLQIKNGKNPKNMFVSEPTNSGSTKQTIAQLEEKKSTSIDSLKKLIHLRRDSTLIGENEDFAILLNTVGKYYFEKRDYSNSLTFYNEALKYTTNNCEETHQILISYFMLKQFVQANKYCSELINCQYPSHKRAYKIAIHTAIEGNYFGQSEQYCLSLIHI